MKIVCIIKLDLFDPNHKDHWFCKCDNFRTINSFVNLLCLIHIALYGVSKSVCVFESPPPSISNLRSTKQAELTKVGSLQLGHTYEVKIIYIVDVPGIEFKK